MAVLGIDVGTTACKAILYDADGKVLGSAREEYRLGHPQKGWAEINPEEMWNAVKKCIYESVKTSKRKVEALAISSHGEGVIPLNAKNEEVGPEIVSFDCRSIEETKRLETIFGKEYFFECGGQLLSSVGTATKIMWMNANPAYFKEKPYAFVCAGDYIALKLTGERVIDFSLASRTMLLDVHKKIWNEELLDYIGIREDVLSKPVQSGTVIGKVSRSCAEELGMLADTIVIAGGHDQPCAMVGAGATHPNAAIYSMGTTETLVCSMQQFTPTLYEQGLCCYPHVLKEQYVTLPGNFTGGNLLKWLKNMLITSSDATYGYEEMLEEMVDYPTAMLLLPHFTATGSPWNDSDSRGMISGLSLDTTRGEFIRLAQEGVTMEILLNLEELKKRGVHIKELIAVGGGTASEKLMQLKANILGIPLLIPENCEAACKGVACLAGVAIGWSKDEFLPYKGSICKEFLPDRELHGQYLENLIKYNRMYQSQKEIWR